MAKKIIELTVSDEYVIGGGVPIGAAGSHDDVVLRITFGEMWTGLNKEATFTDALGENSVLVLITASMLISGKDATYDVTVPAAAKKVAGQMSLSFSGYIVTGGVEDRMTNTAECKFRVLPSKVRLADDETVDATLAQQLRAEMSEAYSKAEEAEATAAEALSRASNAVDKADNAQAIAEEVKAMADRGDFDGDPYILTENDKAVIVAATIEALPKYAGEAIDI